MYGLYTIWIALLLLLLIERRKRSAVISHRIRLNHSKKEKEAMLELAKQFIGKDCLIYTVSASTVLGTIRDVSAGGILVENDGATEIINLDYVVRLREHPKKKNGKKKSVVLD